MADLRGIEIEGIEIRATKTATSVISQDTSLETAQMKTNGLQEDPWSATDVMRKVIWPKTVPIPQVVTEIAVEEVEKPTSANARRLTMVDTLWETTNPEKILRPRQTTKSMPMPRCKTNLLLQLEITGI